MFLFLKFKAADIKKPLVTKLLLLISLKGMHDLRFSKSNTKINGINLNSHKVIGSLRAKN